MKTYSVIIVGAGPAGIFTSLSLLEKGINNIIMLDMGKDIFSRNRKNGNGGELLSGWGKRVPLVMGSLPSQRR